MVSLPTHQCSQIRKEEAENVGETIRPADAVRYSGTC
jgi:hypothetical protein